MLALPLGQCFILTLSQGGRYMGYQVKWVEEHLGVTRKALIGFEKKKLMPENKGGLYREYTEEDIDRIWIIRLLQGMGYTLNEIKQISEDEEFDFEMSLGKKIKQLEKKKEDVERHLGYAKYIKILMNIITGNYLGGCNHGFNDRQRI